MTEHHTHRREKLYCSFCGKSQQEVERLIVGPAGVTICDGCARQAVEICDEPNLPEKEKCP